jgi:hypothetical protein
MPDFTFFKRLQLSTRAFIMDAPPKRLWHMILYSGLFCLCIVTIVSVLLYVHVTRDVERTQSATPTPAKLDRTQLNSIIKTIEEDDALYQKTISQSEEVMLESSR